MRDNPRGQTRGEGAKGKVNAVLELDLLFSSKAQELASLFFHHNYLHSNPTCLKHMEKTAQ